MTSFDSRRSGFSLIELLVVIAIIAIGLTLAVPYFGNASKASQERTIVARLQQDFAWARSAAGVSDASVLNSSLSGLTPTIKITLLKQADGCGWTTTITTPTSTTPTPDSTHSMNATQVAAMAPGISCSGTASSGATLPITFTFTAEGTVDQSATVTYTSGSSTTSWPLMFLMSGSVINTNGLS